LSWLTEIEVRLAQESKAELPMFVTLFGIEMLVTPLQFRNAEGAIVVTPFGTA
jgi:hypothetical protein